MLIATDALFSNLALL